MHVAGFTFSVIPFPESKDSGWATELLFSPAEAGARLRWYIAAMMKTSVGTAGIGTVALLVLGCADSRGPDDTTGHESKNTEPAIVGSVIPASTGFSWIVPNELAAMPLPGRDRPLDQDAGFIEQEGIRLLVSLTEEPPDRATLIARSIESVHIPIEDFTPPTREQMTEFVELVGESVAAGNVVGVHCTAGLGRSGTMSAAYLVSTGVAAADAIATVRELRPGSIETEAQEDAIRRFEESLGDAAEGRRLED